MKRILYIGNHLSRSGGNPSVAELMAPLLHVEGMDLHLVSARRNKVVRLLEMLWAVLRYGRREAPVLIDVYSTLNFYYAQWVAMGCRWLGIPYCCVLHGGNLPQRLLHNPRACRALFGGALRLAAPSGYLQRAFEEAGYSVQVIPNFLDLGRYPFRERRVLRPRLLWVRAFNQIYNPKLAIEVLHQLRMLYPDACLCMVGPDKDGSLAHCQAWVKQLGLEDAVTFTGGLSKSDWIARSAGYDFFINTTRFDNLPVSVLEALALGMPVISTAVGGLPFLIEDGTNGCLVPEGDAAAFVAAIRQYIDDPARAQQLSVQARQKACQFDWAQVKPKWMAFLN
ncbi:MAG: glycosyltransferase family 4 protein [Haliscomenobacter sp.]